MIRYCPHCWREVPLEARLCPYCGQPTDDSDLPFASLRHPEPTRAGLAIHILVGMLHEPRAVMPLAQLLGEADDRFALDQAVRALGEMRDTRAVPALAQLLMDPRAPFFARTDAAAAPGKIGGLDAVSALEAAAAGAPADEHASIAAAAREALAALSSPGCGEQ